MTMWDHLGSMQRGAAACVSAHERDGHCAWCGPEAPAEKRAACLRERERDLDDASRAFADQEAMDRGFSSVAEMEAYDNRGPWWYR